MAGRERVRCGLTMDKVLLECAKCGWRIYMRGERDAYRMAKLMRWQVKKEEGGPVWVCANCQEKPP